MCLFCRMRSTIGLPKELSLAALVITLLKKGSKHIWKEFDDYRFITLLNTELSGNHFEMRLLNLRINFYLLRTFLSSSWYFFCVVSSFTTFRPNFTSGLLQVILPRPRIGTLSLVTVFPVITAFHSCCLSHHVFDQVNLWPAWVGFETAIF